MRQLQAQQEDLSPFVEVLTTEATSEVYGYRVIGGRRGPELLVIGQGATAHAAFERLIGIPSLPWMYGSLTLIRTDTMGARDESRMHAGLSRDLDDTLVLPVVSRTSLAVRQQTNTILRKCAELGMVSGRGVAR